MSEDVYDVLIVGSGLAGLTAAAHLCKQGYRVGLLEARKRIGGRVHSQNIHGFNLELGASYIEGTGDETNPNPLLALCNRYQVQTSALDPMNSDFFTLDGNKSSFAEWQRSLEGNFALAADRIQTAKNSSAENPSLASVLDYGPKIPPTNSKDFAARQLITATIQHHTGANPSEVSLLELRHDDTFTGANALMINGAYRLIEGLQQECEATENFDLFLKSPVKEVHHLSAKSLFQVRTSLGEEYLATSLICAVPLGVLKRNEILFQPALSKAKQKAVRHLSLGAQNHVILEFDQAFWPKDVHYLFPNAENVNDWPEYINLLPFSEGRPILLANLYSDAAKFLKQKDQAILEQVLAPLKKVYKNKVTLPKNVSISRWDTENYTLGSIPYCGLRTTEEDLLAVQESDPLGLYFAGDYTRRRQMHNLNAAFDSGLEVALEIDFYLKNQERIKSTREVKKGPRI